MPAQFTSKFHFGYGWNLGEDEGAQVLDFTTRFLDYLIVDNFATNPSTTVGLVYGYRGGVIYNEVGNPIKLGGGTIQLPANSVLYIERNIDGVVSYSQNGFTGGSFSSMAVIITDDVKILSIEDWRTIGSSEANQVYISEIDNFPNVKNVQAMLEALAGEISNGIGTSSVFGRSGNVVAEKGDYSASLITTNTHGPLPRTIQNDVESVLAYLVSHVTSVITSFKGRAGEVVPEFGDYTAQQVTFVPPVGMFANDVQSAIVELSKSLTGKPVSTNFSTYTPSPFSITPADVAIQLGAMGGVGPYTFELEFDLEDGTTTTLPGATISISNVLHSSISASGSYVAKILITDSDNNETHVSITFNISVQVPLTITTSTPIAIKGYGNSTQISVPLDATGGTSPYNWEVVAGDPTSAFINWVPNRLTNGSWVLSATIPNQNNLTVAVCRIKCLSLTTGQFDFKNLTINTSFALQTSINISDQTIIVDRSSSAQQTSSFTLNITNGYPNYTVDYDASHLPTGVTVSITNVDAHNRNVTISYPKTLANQLTPLIFNVTDSNGLPVSKSINLNFVVTSDLSITGVMSNNGPFTISDHNNETITLSATGGSGTGYTYSIISTTPSSLRSKFSINGNIVSFVPLQLGNTSQTISVMLQATDSLGNHTSITKTFSMQSVTGPVITSFGITSGFDSFPSSFSYHLTAIADVGTSITWTIESLESVPSPANILPGNILTFTAPGPGTYKCIVRCSDTDNLSTSQELTLTAVASPFHFLTMQPISATGSLPAWQPSFIHNEGRVALEFGARDSFDGGYNQSEFFSINDNSGNQVSDTVRCTFLYSGTYYLTLIGTDRSGIRSSSDYTFNAVIPMQINASSTYAYNTAYNSANYTGNIQIGILGGFKQHTWYVENISFSGATGSITIDLHTGLLSLNINVTGGLSASVTGTASCTIRCNDAQGNTISKPIQISITTPNPISITNSDTISVNVTNFDHNDGYVTYTPAQIPLTCTDSAGTQNIVWSIDGATPTANNLIFSVPTNGGPYLIVTPKSNIHNQTVSDSVKVKVTDPNGNVSTKVITVTVIVTTQNYAAPTITNASVIKSTDTLGRVSLSMSCNGTCDSRLSISSVQVTDGDLGSVISNMTASAGVYSGSIKLGDLWLLTSRPNSFIFKITDSIGNITTVTCDKTGHFNAPTSFSFALNYSATTLQATATISLPGLGSEILAGDLNIGWKYDNGLVTDIQAANYVVPGDYTPGTHTLYATLHMKEASSWALVDTKTFTTDNFLNVTSISSIDYELCPYEWNYLYYQYIPELSFTINYTYNQNEALHYMYSYVIRNVTTGVAIYTSALKSMSPLNSTGKFGEINVFAPIVSNNVTAVGIFANQNVSSDIFRIELTIHNISNSTAHEHLQTFMSSTFHKTEILSGIGLILPADNITSIITYYHGDTPTAVGVTYDLDGATGGTPPYSYTVEFGEGMTKNALVNILNNGKIRVILSGNVDVDMYAIAQIRCADAWGNEVVRQIYFDVFFVENLDVEVGPGNG